MMNIRLKARIIILFIFFTTTLSIGQSLVLDVPVFGHSVGSKWCWASVTQMATYYYGNDTELCEIVEWARLNNYISVGNNNCCTYPTSCFGGISSSYIDDVLGSENLSCAIVNDNVTLSTLQSTIDDYRPLIIGGCHNGILGHVMIVKGYDGSYIHYNDGADYGDSYITLYSDAISYECMGRFLCQWEDKTWILTDSHCPDEINLATNIAADADYVAQRNIYISCYGQLDE